MCSETALVNHNLLTREHCTNIMSIVNTEKELLPMVRLSVKKKASFFLFSIMAVDALSISKGRIVISYNLRYYQCTHPTYMICCWPGNSMLSYKLLTTSALAHNAIDQSLLGWINMLFKRVTHVILLNENIFHGSIEAVHSKVYHNSFRDNLWEAHCSTNKVKQSL